jgi:hypothetical protein
MDSRLNQNKTELGVLVLAINFQMLANGDRLFDEVPKVLRDGWAKSCPQTKGMCTMQELRVEMKKKTSMNEYTERINSKSAPWDLRIRRILFPVTKRTWGIPCESRRVTPIWEGVKPLRASLMICSTTSSGVVLSHDGGVRR